MNAYHHDCEDHTEGGYGTPPYCRICHPNGIIREKRAEVRPFWHGSSFIGRTVARNINAVNRWRRKRGIPEICE